MSENKRIKSFVEKFAKTPEEIKAEMRVMEEAKKTFTQDVTILERNLSKFNSIIDPLLDPDGNPLCWIRRPTQKEWEEMVPEELLSYDKYEDVPFEIVQKYRGLQFFMMEKLIVIPKHDAEWWKEHSTLDFQQLFQMHLADVYRKLGVMVENF